MFLNVLPLFQHVQNIRVNEEFKELEQKLKDERDLVVIHAGFKFESSIPEVQKLEPDDWWVRDPMTKLKKYIKESGYRLIDLFRDFDKDGNNTISRDEFIAGVQVISLLNLHCMYQVKWWLEIDSFELLIILF